MCPVIIFYQGVGLHFSFLCGCQLPSHCRRWTSSILRTWPNRRTVTITFSLYRLYYSPIMSWSIIGKLSKRKNIREGSGNSKKCSGLTRVVGISWRKRVKHCGIVRITRTEQTECMLILLTTLRLQWINNEIQYFTNIINIFYNNIITNNLVTWTNKLVLAVITSTVSLFYSL